MDEAGSANPAPLPQEERRSPGPDAPPPSASAPARPAARVLDELLGLPAVSGDGMHVAYLIGDELQGPLHLRITRLDGSVLVERQLLAAQREVRSDAHEPLGRAARGRVESARRELERARMRPLTSLATQTPDATHPLASGDGCQVPQRIDGAWSDPEHGLVVLRLVPQWSASCPRPLSATSAGDEQWRIIAPPPPPGKRARATLTMSGGVPMRWRPRSPT